MSTYQVHAIGVQKRMYVIATMLATIPISAGGSLTRRRKVPTRNTPNTGPLINDATDNA